LVERRGTGIVVLQWCADTKLKINCMGKRRATPFKLILDSEKNH